MPPHLTDEALNEYLDAALPPAEREAAAAHLAVCQPCAARLTTLRALFAGLEALPAVPLARDLTAGVLRALPPGPAAAPVAAPAPLAMRNSARRPAVPWLVLAAEVLVALVLLWIAWPLITNVFAAAAWPAALSTFAADWLARLPSLAPAAWLADAQRWLTALLPAPASVFDWPALTGLAPLTLALAVAGAAALWLVGNALLLRRSLTTLLRRRA